MANRWKKMWSYAGLLPNPTVNSLTLYSPAHCHRAQHCTLHVGRVSIEPLLKRIRQPSGRRGEVCLWTGTDRFTRGWNPDVRGNDRLL